ncbi:UDP-N-acetylglucosamine--N-acetylmuramyl-(pentapeptide) pyrophosphoryl-undecaprenol N-acetylglucosamine transferase [Halolactibacillus alkaliphilus]|uniref:UDP-N-acetylglucosamine--N-acetylmuramyl-(pentapeptide) pyrophosphoryl-undecaprenol N-acetylglucosamine transferase n=1 Tax=Halolactibacillus alkaliphilus TaxID=442899 RepID=A0A511X1Q4_9BACI|nr:undecaprenyldiphospho-muramoylpentapeptide beta-N-acetylglucosaminyltransferase [Halolactibacillus alkaliphilus]GEN56886.1 UDP-N-acetylglucosamine--N-acetylmuramyl-(pentapeptide) pyrophosphoryl-undecaprenol N-acetylglucosamine transferase [Halolactibacillus alkaliphilus]GGN71293.1 UDP-N-acetylglucosamine--N-acetylmuramyl-(pentapeptide) pyrophosphoryl-undecaprenol N-acetylglucosamine transferase [Halolactibacillus alkaliphilus]SFO82703.1 UDP-N-acetylglucosamine-N-acetylmuramylpentapeptide N-ac
MTMKQIILTGGGTAGHVMVNLALIPLLQKEGYMIDYIGSIDGIEKELITPIEGVTYHAISTGKYRRYRSIDNLKDPFKVLNGIRQSVQLILKLKPSIIFSKGGFVSVPVLIAAKLTNTPAVIHESDLTPGLANKIAMPFAKRILVTFEKTLQYVDEKKARFIGAVVRPELFEGSKQRACEKLMFDPNQPIMLIMGGSTGSKHVNTFIRDHLDRLTKKYQVIHLTGKALSDETVINARYKQYEYVADDLKDLLMSADVIVSRAGANAIFEFLALKKPMILIPLSKKVSRGDQLLNAAVFKEAGFAKVIEEDELKEVQFFKTLAELEQEAPEMIKEMAKRDAKDAIFEVLKAIHTYEK